MSDIKFNWVTPAIVIPLLTAIGYGVAFTYEFGFCEVFNIPVNVIEIDLTSILIAVILTAVVLGIAFSIWYPYIFKPIEKAPQHLRSSLNLLAGMLFPVIMIMLIYREMWNEWLWILVSVIAVWVCYVIFPFLWRLFKKIFASLRKGNKPEELQEPVWDINLNDKISIRKLIFIFTTIVLVILWCSYMLGQGSAKTQEEFMTIAIPQDLVVLRIYGNNMICAPVDKIKSEITGDLIILYREGYPDLLITIEHLGRLVDK